MGNGRARVGSIGIVLFLGAWSVNAAGQEPRTWTNRDGRTVEATFVRLDGETLVMKNDQGEFRVPLASLSQADQDYAAEQAAQREAARPLSQITRLWHFADGDSFDGKFVAIVKGKLQFRKGSSVLYKAWHEIDQQDRRFMIDSWDARGELNRQIEKLQEDEVAAAIVQSDLQRRQREAEQAALIAEREAQQAAAAARRESMPESGAEEKARRRAVFDSLKQLGLAYHSCHDANGRGPLNWQEAAQFGLSSDAAAALKAEGHIVHWGVKMLDATGGSSNFILAYPPNAASEGGIVLLLDGSVRLMLGQEFSHALARQKTDSPQAMAAAEAAAGGGGDALAAVNGSGSQPAESGAKPQPAQAKPSPAALPPPPGVAPPGLAPPPPPWMAPPSPPDSSPADAAPPDPQTDNRAKPDLNDPLVRAELSSRAAYYLLTGLLAFLTIFGPILYVLQRSR